MIPYVTGTEFGHVEHFAESSWSKPEPCYWYSLRLSVFTVSMLIYLWFIQGICFHPDVSFCLTGSVVWDGIWEGIWRFWFWFQFAWFPFLCSSVDESFSDFEEDQINSIWKPVYFLRSLFSDYSMRSFLGRRITSVVSVLWSVLNCYLRMFVCRACHVCYVCNAAYTPWKELAHAFFLVKNNNSRSWTHAQQKGNTEASWQLQTLKWLWCIF